MDIDSILCNMIKEEVEYFYKYIRNYDQRRNIDIVIADDIYKKILEYNMCDFQKKYVLNRREEIYKLNGTLIFAPNKDGKTLVALSHQRISKNELNKVRRTLIHELTHAHDFYDFADYLKINVHNDIFREKYYTAFFYWTEFHASQLGHKRYLECKYSIRRNKLKQLLILHKYNADIICEIKNTFLTQSSKGCIYDLMQTIGKYYSFIKLCPLYKGNFKNDVLESNTDKNLISILEDVYKFLIANTTFDKFIMNIEIFDRLLEKMSQQKIIKY